MSQVLWKALRLAPAAIGAIFVIANPALANEALDGSTNFSGSFDEFTQANPTDEEGDGAMGQVTSVSQLRDVQPTDWAFQALQNLVERYACIAGYPDGTFRGNRALTRYEFAAGLNACLEQITRLIGTGGGLSAEDLATLERLQQEFAAELATLRGRVDALEVRVAELEANQFSTTTKLRGESIFGLTVAEGETAFGGDVSSEPIFATRTRLNFDTSFTGQDLLRTRLQVANLQSYSGNATFYPEGDLKFDAGLYQEGDSTFRLDTLLYSAPIGPAQFIFMANNGAADDFASTINPLDGDGGSGALSRFGTRAPIYNLVNGEGIALRTNLGPAEISLGYLANLAENPRQGAGLVHGPYGGLAQIVVRPADTVEIGLTYVNAYGKRNSPNDLQTGSDLANLSSTALFDTGEGFTTVTNAYNLGVGARFGRLAVGGWVGYSNIRFLDRGFRGDQNVWNGAVTLGVTDLIKPGSLLGLIVGVEPKVTDADNDLTGLTDPDTSIHVEGFYQFQLTDNIAITPGVIWLTAPNHNAENEDLVIGTIRTTFSF